MKKPELLVPVGDFDCLKAAVQNGADAVYLGLDQFNARYSAKNFTLDTLKEAVDYAHLRGVQVHLTLNILIKDKEWDEAISLVKHAYELGIDAIIVQDLGLINYILEYFPDLPVHASTQMTCHNLEGALYLQGLGVKRIVLARELSLSEIEYIKSNISAEIEVFTHGALCICYSGQCLYSSLIGGRSGNRGKCAQGCRLPYELLEDDTCIDKGYLLSPRDLCSLEVLPELLETNVDSLKIEGRMKSPEYVAVVTRIYRKQIDKAISGEPYSVDPQDMHDLLQVFNRGEFSTGHLERNPNTELIYKEKPNHQGIFVGQVSNYLPKKGHIALHTQDILEIGDTITFEHEPTKYTISELMKNGTNIKQANLNEKVEIGRMKGNISVGDKIYKLASKSLTTSALHSYMAENTKTPLNAVLDVHLDKPIRLRIFDNNGIEVKVSNEETPDFAINNPITADRLKQQLSKTTDTPFEFKSITINLDNNLYIPHIRSINELRREALEQYANIVCEKYRRKADDDASRAVSCTHSVEKDCTHKKISLLLNILNPDYDYAELNGIDKLYVPLKYFCDAQYEDTLQTLTNQFKTYIYTPSIMRANYKNLFKNYIDECLERYNIQGFVVSNIGYIELLKEYASHYELIGNYTLNVFNSHTVEALPMSVITLSPELNKAELNHLSVTTQKTTEFIIYGNLPLMTTQYCLLGNSNKCYPGCDQKCKTNHHYYLKDRMNFKFRLVPDNLQTVTTLYNSKITSVTPQELSMNNARIDILDESVTEINKIIETVKSGKRIEGQQYTNGNLNREV